MKKNKLLSYLIAVTISICVMCIVAALGIQASEQNKTKTADQYFEEFGGNIDVYVEILALTDCKLLQEKFDIASANNSREQAGTQQYRWTLGYMKASDDRMREIGCYDKSEENLLTQIPQVDLSILIAQTSSAAQTQTMISAPFTFTPFSYFTATYMPPATLAPTWTPIPTNTLLVLPTQETISGDPNSQCVCTQDVYNCGDPLEQICFNYCNAAGYGDIHRLDGDNNGLACDG